jgi:ABC-type transport system substrate-binding protein
MFMNFWFDSKMQGLQGNRSFYSNPEVDKLIREAAAVSDTAKRVELYQTAQKKVLDDSVYTSIRRATPCRCVIRSRATCSTPCSNRCSTWEA